MTTTKVLLADDHPIVLDGIKAVLQRYPEIKIIGEVGDGEAVIEFINHQHPDVVVLDINMPVMDGIACSRRLKKSNPEIRIIILTMYAQRSFIDEVLKIGVDGCLLKNNSGQELGEAILRVASGRSYFDMIKTFNPDEEKAQSKLSNREIEIIQFLAQGLTSLQIAEKLFIAEHTVKTHRKNILKKLGMHGTSELVQYALNNKLI